MLNTNQQPADINIYDNDDRNSGQILGVILYKP